jgi:hypothetical protein
MARHIIINTQPGDEAPDKVTGWMQNKPTNGQWQERLAFKLDQEKQLDLSAEDKVYLVGHGGDDGTLGGMSPIELHNKVRRHVLPAAQINMVMCGTIPAQKSVIAA